MIPLAPTLLVAAANAFVGLGEEGGDNRGQMVELFLREVKHPPGQPWCAAFVYHIGYCAHYDHKIGKSSWPLRPRRRRRSRSAFRISFGGARSCDFSHTMRRTISAAVWRCVARWSRVATLWIRPLEDRSS